MRCGCPSCGIYMVQSERGLSSGCVCPNCGHACAACMGTVQPPVSREEIAARAEALLAMRDAADNQEDYE